MELSGPYYNEHSIVMRGSSVERHCISETVARERADELNHNFIADKFKRFGPELMSALTAYLDSHEKNCACDLCVNALTLINKFRS